MNIFDMKKKEFQRNKMKMYIIVHQIYKFMYCAVALALDSTIKGCHFPFIF